MKTVSDDADVTFSGSVFHSRAAATGKASSADDWWNISGLRVKDVTDVAR